MESKNLKWFKYRGVYLASDLKMEQIINKVGEAVMLIQTDLYATHSPRYPYEVKPVRTTRVYAHRVTDEFWKELNKTGHYRFNNKPRPAFVLHSSESGDYLTAQSVVRSRTCFVSWDVYDTQEQGQSIGIAENVTYGSIQDHEHIKELCAMVEDKKGHFFLGFSIDTIRLIAKRYAWNLVYRYDGEHDFDCCANYPIAFNLFLKKLGDYAKYQRGNDLFVPDLRIPSSKPLTPLHDVQAYFYDEDSCEEFWIVCNYVKDANLLRMEHLLSNEDNVTQIERIERKLKVTDLPNF